MNIRPLGDRVLVKREEAEEVTAGGIIIPDTAKDKPSKGTIVAVGEGARNDKGELIKMTLEAGDKVYFTKWGGSEVKLNDEELLIMKENDVLAIIE